MPGRPAQPLPRVEAIPEDQASAFAILRRPQVDGDRLPEGIVTWTSTLPAIAVSFHGLVPDGVCEVSLVTTTGATAKALVRANVYGAVLDGPFLQSVCFTGPVVLGP